LAVTIRIWAYPDSYLVINGQRVRPGSYQVDKGSSVPFMINAKNHGTAGPAWLGIRNRNTGEILKWRSYSVGEGQVFYYSGTITVNNDMNLELVGGQLTNEGRIIQHSYGTWSITVKEPVEVPSVPPIARIQGIKVNGESVSNGGYKTISTASITVSVRVSNVGSKGTIAAHIDIKDSGGNRVYSTTKTVSMYAGETRDVTFNTTLPKEDKYRVTVSVDH